jgi:cell wall-associated NlpC family hydrolase
MDNVQKFFEDVKDLIKAIGTSSSVDQERDERSVENYVRQSANTNTNNLQTGGNTMSNTTEPDPQGNIAVQKDLPAANQPASTDLVNQETRPTDGATVSDAPNQVTDVSSNGAGIYKAGMTCPDCNQAIEHKCAADSTKDDESKVEKAASEDEVTETVEKAVDEAESKEEAAAETPADEKAELKKSVSSVWGGAFAPIK